MRAARLRDQSLRHLNLLRFLVNSRWHSSKSKLTPKQSLRQLDLLYVHADSKCLERTHRTAISRLGISCHAVRHDKTEKLLWKSCREQSRMQASAHHLGLVAHEEALGAPGQRRRSRPRFCLSLLLQLGLLGLHTQNPVRQLRTKP